MAIITNPSVAAKVDRAAKNGTVLFIRTHNSNGWRNQIGSHAGMMRALDRRYKIRGTGVMPGSTLGINSKYKLGAWQQDNSGNIASRNKRPPAPFDAYAASGPNGNIASITQDSAGVVKIATVGTNYVNANHVVDIAGTDITGAGWTAGATTDAAVLSSPAATRSAFYVAGTTSGSTNTGTYQASRNTLGGWWQLGLYLAAGQTISNTGWPLTVIDSTMRPAVDLRSCNAVFRARYGVFNVGTSAPANYDVLFNVRDAAANKQWYLRNAGGIGTTNGTSSPAYISLSAGANAVQTWEQVFPADATRTGDLSMRPNYNGDHAIKGPWWLGSWQWWSLDQLTGCTETQALSFGGASMNEIADLITNTIQTSWIAELLTEAARPATYSGQRPVWVVEICETLNQRNASAIPSVPNGIAPGDSNAAWYDSCTQVMKRWKEGKAATGLDGDLYFYLHRDHRVAPGDVDDSKMAGYQTQIERICAENPNDTFQINPAEFRKWMNPKEIDPIANITAATVANPTEITTGVNHGLSTGDLVMFGDVTGITLSGSTFYDTYYPVTVTAANKITIPANVTASSSPTGKIFYQNSASGSHQTLLGYELQGEIAVGIMEMCGQLGFGPIPRLGRYGRI